MNKRLKILLLVAALLLGALAGSAHSAAAQTSPAGGLPPFNIAPSALLDLKGSITVGPQVLQLSGTGAQAGDRFRLDLNFTPSGGPTLTLNEVQVGSMFYYMMTGGPGWQSIDLTTTPGNVPNIQSNIPGINGFNPNGGQRTFEATGPAQQVGKETVGGVATTKYMSDVDVAKLFTSIGTPAAQAQGVAAVSKMTATVWVGDADGYLYQSQVVLNTKAPNPAGGFVDVVVDFTITYHDFNARPIIVAPGAGPATQPGMPRTGVADLSAPLAVGVVGVILAALGLAVRRRRPSGL